MNKRRTFTADEKQRSFVDILGQGPVSDLAQEHQVQPSQIHNWVNQAKHHLTSSSIERQVGQLVRVPTRKIKRSLSSRPSSHRSTK